MGVRVTPAAELDIGRISQYLASTSLAIADEFIDAADRTMREIERNPGAGALYGFEDSRLHGIRRRAVEGFQNHLVFYREIGDGVEIVRVLHGARDVTAQL